MAEGLSSKRSAPLQLVQTADGTATLQNTDHHETYHSTFGAVTESAEVFLSNSQVQQRLQNKQPTRVLEIGFGTGLNFLLTANIATQQQCQLVYEAIEYNLPPWPLIHSVMLQNLPSQTDMTAALEKHLSPGRQIATPIQINDYIALNLRLENALHAKLQSSAFDAIYLDAFSSKNNPDLWTAQYLATLHAALEKNGILATYSVNRAFREALLQAGFSWKKHKGPPGKREVLTAWRAN